MKYVHVWLYFCLDMINTTRTQLALGVGEFERYTVGNQTVITFCLKEFRALLTFSESVGVPVTAHFETAGRYIFKLYFDISHTHIYRE